MRLLLADHSITQGVTLEAERYSTMRTSKRDASKSRSSKWGNTLMGQRNAKIQARAKRLEDEEAERVRLDNEEEMLRQNQRLEIVNRAVETLIGNTDRIKLLKSAELTSTVIETRRKQLALKERERRMAQEEEAEAHAELLHSLAEARLKEEAQMAARRRQIAETSAIQKQQLADFVNRKVEDLQQQVEEGKRLAADAALLVEEEKRMLERKKQAVAEANLEAKRKNAELIRFKEDAAAAAVREENDRRLYAEQQDRKTAIRAEIVQEKRAEASRKAANIADRVTREFQQYMSTEKGRVEAAAKEAEDRADKLLQDRRARQLQMHRDNAVHRLSTMARKEQETKDRLASEAQEMRNLVANSKMLADREAQARAEKRERMRAVQAFHLAQMADKKRGIEDAREQQRSAAAEAAAISAGAATGDAAGSFTDASAALIAKERALGHSTLPLQRKIRQTLLDPLYPADATF